MTTQPSPAARSGPARIPVPRRALPVLLVAPLAAGLAACTPADILAPAPAGAATLENFGSCEELLGYFQEHALERVGPWGLAAGGGWGVPGSAVEDVDMAAEAGDELEDAGSVASDAATAMEGTDYSGTNNQVMGVEEPDVVQTDGKIIVTVRGSRVVVVDAASTTKLSSLRLPLRGGEGHSELLLDRATGRLLVLTQEWGQGEHTAGTTVDGLTTMPAFGTERTVLTVVDLSDPAEPTVVGGLRLEGGYRSARMHDGTARVVLVTPPPGLALAHPRDGSLVAEQEAEQTNRRIIEESTIGDWLPHLQLLTTTEDGTTAGTPEQTLDCDDVARPPEFSGLSTMSVLTLDLSDRPRPTSATGLVAQGSTVYASAERLVVATSPWDAWELGGDPMPRGGRDGGTTALHTFDLTDDGGTAYLASGRVQGRLLNQFSLDETDGVIRVATTKDTTSDAPSSSSLVMLAEEGRRLVETGRVDDLGITERIYAVRYLSSDLAAVVTFRETDPLYLVDTSDPAAPTVTGELKIPGYSAYLHPVGDDLLLGLGQDATEDGMTTGMQLSVFDVSDPADPRRVSQVGWDDHYSEAEQDHRAFRYWAPTGQVFVPTYAWHKDTSWSGVTSARLDGPELARGPELRLGGSGDTLWDNARRTLVVDDQLWVLGEHTLRAADLATLEEQARITL